MELAHLGPNHSTLNIVIRLPKEKINLRGRHHSGSAVPGPLPYRLLPAPRTEAFHREGDSRSMDRAESRGHPGCGCAGTALLGTRTTPRRAPRASIAKNASAKMKKLGQAAPKVLERGPIRHSSLPKYENMPGGYGPRACPFVAPGAIAGCGGRGT